MWHSLSRGGLQEPRHHSVYCRRGQTPDATSIYLPGFAGAPQSPRSNLGRAQRPAGSHGQGSRVPGAALVGRRSRKAAPDGASAAAAGWGLAVADAWICLQTDGQADR
jgi:hypothetical protein